MAVNVDLSVWVRYLAHFLHVQVIMCSKCLVEQGL